MLLLGLSCLASWLCRVGAMPVINGTNGTLVYYYYSPRPYAFRRDNNVWVTLFPKLALNDSDSPYLGFAQVVIELDTFDDDRLRFPDHVNLDRRGLTAYYALNGAVAVLFGTSTVENYQSALRSLRYRASETLSLKQRPNSHERSLTLTVVDADDNAASATTRILVKTARTCINHHNPVTLER